MYSRNFNRTQRNENQRYNPPPGYVGTAFSGKHHRPMQEVGEQSEPVNRYNREQNENGLPELDFDHYEPRRPQSDRYEQQDEREEGIRQENIPIMENEVSCRGKDPEQALSKSVEDGQPEERGNSDEKSPLHDLLEILHGKIGTEELIILMVMLLVASDGIGVEVLILALALLAG